MTEEQAEKVLEELNSVRPEMLNGEAKRLFEAIMKIADERDEACKDIKKKDKQIERYINILATNDMLHVKECEEKDNIIASKDRLLSLLTIEQNDNEKELEKLRADIENKNRIMDLIIENLFNLYKNQEPCDLSIDIDCKKYKKCKDCIKQYFENKAKEVK